MGPVRISRAWYFHNPVNGLILALIFFSPTDRNSSFDKKSSFDRSDGRLERKKSKSSSLDKSKSSSLDKDVKVRSRNSSGYEPSPKRDLRPRSASGKDLTDEVRIPTINIFFSVKL